MINSYVFKRKFDWNVFTALQKMLSVSFQMILNTSFDSSNINYTLASEATFPLQKRTFYQLYLLE